MDVFEGMKYKLHVPDMFIKNGIMDGVDYNRHCLENLAVAAQWITFASGEWIELGVTVGSINGVCETTPHVYYAWNVYDMKSDKHAYHEHKITGEFDVGDVLTFEIGPGNAEGTWALYWNE